MGKGVRSHLKTSHPRLKYYWWIFLPVPRVKSLEFYYWNFFPLAKFWLSLKDQCTGGLALKVLSHPCLCCDWRAGWVRGGSEDSWGWRRTRCCNWVAQDPERAATLIGATWTCLQEAHIILSLISPSCWHSCSLPLTFKFEMFIYGSNGKYCRLPKSAEVGESIKSK